ncbi:hypothetical protein ONE63_011287 [Megalurothrips usitatus]|uniref:Major facilitator superfamily (MFS) profile domain-containing protein n=1 Tax=Megalurothrips usitatus TaxID=439358 RepID=A0AAV7X4V7_9NEOP|nr:hypothetical protein ONE63_011287 [Megalurothrips usitatus]
MLEMQEQRDQTQPKGAPGGKSPAVGLEEALELTGYGKFNYKLLLGVWLGMATQNFVTTDMAYSLPAAECDLELTAMQKGWINAALYVGMMSTAFVWGALSDVLGRKWLLALAYALLGACGVTVSLVTSSWVFLVCRMVTGMLMIGPASLCLTYAGELFSPQYRSKMFMWAGTMQGVSAASHAALAMWIIPQELAWLRSWRVFMLVSAAVAACTAAYMLLLPESPKYLAAQGRQRESIGVLQAIYVANTGLPASTYPVKELTLSKHMQPDHGNPFAIMAHQFGKLVRKPYQTPLLFAIAIQPLVLFCTNTIRMWVPQIFAQMERDGLAGDGYREVCSIMEDSRPLGNQTAGAAVDCDTFRIDPSVYLYSIIIMSARACIQLLASIIIRPIGQKPILVTVLCVAVGILIAWPFAASPYAVLGLACVFEGMAHTAYSTILNILVELFPTGVRSSAVSLSHFFGRAGSMAGNIVFPLLFTRDCASAFFIAAAFLLCEFLPRPDCPDLRNKPHCKICSATEFM